MAGAFTVVDLSQLQPPNVVEALNFETILAQMLADLRARDPSFNALVESDPAYKILEVAAYRELLMRQRVNEAAKAVMLAFAKGADLDQLGANFNVPRLLIEKGDPNAVPPTPDVYEGDDEFRARIPLSLESYTTAGSEGSYVFHGLSADGDVRDISATSPTPGHVAVYVLSRTGNGQAPQQLLDKVAAALNADRVRPMTDQLSVLSASILEYTIDAELVLYPGPDADVVLQAAHDAAQAYANSLHRNGYDVSLSGIFRALHQPGVQQVNLSAPTANIVVSDGQAPYCTGINLTVATESNV
ncbi:putative baseplate J-like protein [Ralstonia phage phiRSP]|uniref:Putative baseplate J-like protein n=1 Tax=Ralstonia phage phiRSP TaxID=2201420 RepID=A0A345ANT4_9CAUD|nr:baseplate protein [Ralstonia phage phiRSP]AXF38223.1 putative baseplate J-like protein [Ralstonia phage phiRSP]